MARQLDQFDDIVVKDVYHRHQFQSTSSGNIIQHLYSHVTGNTANVSVAEIVSADGLNQGQWDLLVNSSARRLDANTITTANAASLTANSAISVRTGNTIFRSANVIVTGNLSVSNELVANIGRFTTCILNGPVSGTGVTSLVTSGSTALVTSGGVFTALANVSAGSGNLSTAPDQPTIRSVGTLTSLNVAGSLVVNAGTLRVETNTVRIGQTYDGLWASGSGADARNWFGVASGNGVFVAVGNGSVGNRAMSSSDGKTWTLRPSSADNSWSAVAYGNGVFVAVASTGSNRSMFSTNNGQNWTGRASVANNWMSVAFGGGVFVAVANTGIGNRAKRSTNNGSTWTTVTTVDNLWTSVTYGNNLFVAVSTDGGSTQVMTSPTGETWTLQTSAAANSWDSVTFGNGLFVAVSADGVGNQVMTSLNGETWTSRTTPASYPWTSVTYGNGLFVAVASSGDVMTSPDGITWTVGASASANSWNGVVYGNGLFVAVSSTGVGRAMYANAPNLADLDVLDSVSVAGAFTVGGSLVVRESLTVGQGQGPRLNLSNNQIQFTSNGAVDASMTTVGATANEGNGTGELVFTGRDYTYAGTTYNDGVNPSTGVVEIQAYPLYPVITDAAQSIRQYALGQRFWSGKVPRNTVTPQTLQFWGSGNFPLYGTFSVQYMTKSGTFHNATAMVMRGSEASPGNTSAVRWATLSSNTSSTGGLSITFGVVSSWVPQISFANTTSVNAWFQVSAVVFDDATIHGEAAS